ncbi:MAG: inositol monophosphatase [Prevotellaceae bacterium]|nr:inositol monophosphatase [Candidatus Minthosoma caballi]
MKIDLLEILEKVKQLALKVGEFQSEQRKTFSIDFVESKHNHDYVSYVDKESEKMIVSYLKEILPDAGFITEEKTVVQNAETAEYSWIVDPLDGTTNFIHDLGPWCVCIALQNKEEYLLGVVYEVTRKELFFATKDNGAWRQSSNGELSKLQVSKIEDIDQALIMVGYPYNAEDYRDFCMKISGNLYGHCASIRSYGSAEAELCYLAAGRIDIYFESFIQPWDVAAGAAIIQEAGGKLSDYDGKDDNWKNGLQVLATNGLLHKAILSEIQKHKP